jgi:hypothetical protein
MMHGLRNETEIQALTLQKAAALPLTTLYQSEEGCNGSGQAFAPIFLYQVQQQLGSIVVA